ncbi:hypothetical protein [Pararhodospirillum photometricum]|uniref:hypothetical protein n=1 Tax=Pararhodospirillum photometricum TaxID=1084 RepID=UPI0012FF3583|nr:hypothetical protein [Pararhodospirillum photometricum]
MMSVLSCDQILEDLECQGATDGAPLVLSDKHRLIEILNPAGQVIRDTDAPTLKVRKMLEDYSFCLTETAREYLESVPIFVVNSGQFHTYAARRDQGPYVTIFSGVLEAALYRLSLSVLGTNLCHMLRRKAPDPEGALATLKPVMTAARDLSLVHFKNLKALPLFSDIFIDTHKQQIVDGMHGCLTYVAMHEIGHIALTHGLGASSYSREQEIAADRFALKSILPRHHRSFITNMLIAFDLYSELERKLALAAREPRTVPRVDSIAATVNSYHHDEYLAQTVSSVLTTRSRKAQEMGEANDEDGLKALELLISLYDRVDYLSPVH